MSKNSIKAVACLCILFICGSVFAQEAVKDSKPAAVVKAKAEAAKPAAAATPKPAPKPAAVAPKPAAPVAAVNAKPATPAKVVKAAAPASLVPAAPVKAVKPKPVQEVAVPAAAVKPAPKVDDRQKYTGFWIHTFQCPEKGQSTCLLNGTIDDKGSLTFDCVLQATDYLPKYKASKVMKDQVEIEFDILGCEEKAPCTAKYSLLYHEGKLLGQIFVTGMEPEKVILSRLEKDQYDEMIILVGKDAQSIRQKAIEAAEANKKKIAELTAALKACTEQSAKLTRDLAAVKEMSAAEKKALAVNIETLNANLAKVTAEKESIAAQLGKTVTEKQALTDKLAADAAKAVQEKAALTQQAAAIQAAAQKAAADSKAVTDQLTAQVNATVAENNTLKASVAALTKEKAAAAGQVAAAQKQAQVANNDLENVKQYYTFLKKRNEQQNQRIEELEKELEFYTQQIQKLRRKLTNDKTESSLDQPVSPVGNWKSIDFVKNIEDFKPGEKKFKGSLYLTEFVFKPQGKTHKPFWIWREDMVCHTGDKTISKFKIINMDNKDYLFFEWMSGDVTRRGMKPSYYVLERNQ